MEMRVVIHNNKNHSTSGASVENDSISTRFIQKHSAAHSIAIARVFLALYASKLIQKRFLIFRKSFHLTFQCYLMKQKHTKKKREKTNSDR